MKVRMSVDVSGSRNGQPWPAKGQVADLPDTEAADLCASGMAEPVASLPGEDAETRTEPKRRGRKATEPGG